MFTVDDYLSQHAADAEPGECTDTIRDNAMDLLPRVQALLQDFGEDRGLRSGWRPASFNARAGGAVHSKHMTGQAVDLDDNDGSLDAWLTDAMLEKHGLAREAPQATESWCHLQSVLPPSGHRTFLP